MSEKWLESPKVVVHPFTTTALTHQRLDGGRARDAAHRRRGGPHEGVIVEGCNTREILN